MTLKRFLAALFSIMLVFALACGGGGETAVDEEEEEEGEEAEVQETTATPEAGGAPAAAATGGGTISGTIKLEGTAPAMPTIQMAADPNCQAAHKTPVKTLDVVVGPAGELANVFVYVKDFKGAAPKSSGSLTLDQRGCLYYPHVSGLQVGQTLEIKNSDATLHNIHALPKVNREFNESQPVQGMISKKKLDKPEVMVKFKCDVHAWMNAYMAVLPHPFFGTSNAQGTFTIANVPAGTYTVEAWHEKYGTQTQQVTVAEGQPVQVSFTFKAS